MKLVALTTFSKRKKKEWYGLFSAKLAYVFLSNLGLISCIVSVLWKINKYARASKNLLVGCSLDRLLTVNNLQRCNWLSGGVLYTYWYIDSDIDNYVPIISSKTFGVILNNLATTVCLINSKQRIVAN